MTRNILFLNKCVLKLWAYLLGILSLILCISTPTEAQEVNFSQFQLAPTFTNPAMIATSNQYQFILNYRNQFVGSGETFTTPMASFIAPLINRKEHRRFGALSASIFDDRVGEKGLMRTIGTEVAFAFNIPFDLPLGLPILYDSYLSFGVQGGFFRRSIDINAITTGSQWVGNIFDPNAPRNEIFVNDFVDFRTLNAGFLWYSQDTTEVMRAYIGFSARNINQPNVGFLNVSADRMPISYTFIAGMDAWTSLDGRFSIQPNIRWINFQTINQFNLGSFFRYHFGTSASPKGFLKEGSMSIGVWYSTTNGIIGSFGFHQPNYAISMSYDLASIRGSRVPTQSGAVELTVAVKFGKRRIGFKKYNPYEDIPTYEDFAIDTIPDDQQIVQIDTVKATTVVVSENPNNELPPKDLSIFDKPLFFYYASDLLNVDTIEKLEQIALLMNNYKDIKVEVQGHACDIARTKEENNHLSLKRAKAVKDFLLSKGVEDTRIMTAGFGDSQPAAANNTEQGREMNRRVEFKLLAN